MDSLPPGQPSPPSPPPRITALVWALVVLLLVWIAPTLVERFEYSRIRGRERAEVESARSQLPSPTLEEISRQSALIAKAIGPSVVHIDTKQLARSRQRNELTQYSPRGYRVVQGQGSGVVIDEQGYVITNAHVVDGADQIDVKLNDFDIREGKVVGSDPATDLALLKIPSGGLIAAPWGDSDDLPVGALVWAIGNPFGLDRSVTMGIVSAKNRRVDARRSTGYQDFLQTDAAVNPGNSGGPLVDSAGQIIGINTAIVGPSYQGVSFSIPSAIARAVYEQLKATGSVVRGYLGVRPGNLTPELAQKLGVDATEGALVEEVYPETPADRAGIRPGDVIVQWNGHPVIDAMALKLLVGQTPVGSKGTATVVREGETRQFEVTVETLPAQPPVAR